jgi:hypothetical protein
MVAEGKMLGSDVTNVTARGGVEVTAIPAELLRL